jgi:hypothetical protein
MNDEEVEATRQKYINILTPVFLPENPTSNDIVNYFASLLRIVGMEDKGWDPHLESRAILEDLNSIMQVDLPEEKFPDKDSTIWRIGLLMYSHMVEMDAPYEVLANLLRFRLGLGYSPNPFFQFLKNSKEKKQSKSRGLSPSKKIEIIKTLSNDADIAVGDIFDEFYNSKLRNAISHSDYIITDEEFRCRNGIGGARAFSLSLAELNKIITTAKIFISTFFGLEKMAREHWGSYKYRAIPYDPIYKGLMEVLVNDDNLMCGLKVHWPNSSESVYRRKDDGIDMINCMLDMENSTIDFFVDQYARKADKFSPLVEEGGVPKYTKLESGLTPKWERQLE